MKLVRYLSYELKKSILKKMIFIGGPRQVGKTTLAKSFIKSSKQYLTWDDIHDRELIISHQLNLDLKTVVLDELHKYARWRLLLKGMFDKYHQSLKILVTGSARLDLFRKGGDSLFGRYRYYRLHPFSLSEVDKKFQRKTTLELLHFSGFPEPFLSKSESELKIWQRERKARVVHQDVSDLSTVKDLSQIDILVSMLPGKVGSPLSIDSIRKDLEVSPNTVKNWIKLLESVYYCYTIIPYGPPLFKAVKKMAKLYLWDWSEVINSGAKFENFVASHLLKYCHFVEDTQGDEMELRYIRDVEGREIDFVVLKNKQPLFAVECKTGEGHLSKHLYYFKQRTKIPIFYQVHLGEKYLRDENIFLLPFEKFCQIEKIP